MLKEMLSLFLTFAKVGVMTFGGGYAMLPILQREVVENRHWATEDELIDYYAIGQCTPGVIAVNTSTFIGCKTHGILGGIAATAGMITPSLIIITIIAAFIQQFAHLAVVQHAFAGIRIAVCALVLQSVWKMAKKGVMLVAAPASWPAMHIYQWDVLTRARAIENGLCIAAVNMSGNYRGMKMGGHSRFIDPLGKVQAEAGEEESVLYADYDEKAYKDLGKQLAVIRLDKQRCFHA